MSWTEDEYRAYLKRDKPPSWASTEKKFMAQIVKIACQLGWHFYHTFNSFHSAAGYPDLALVRGNRYILAELKTEKGKLSKEQEKWLKLLEPTPVEQYLWRPSQIEDILRILR